MKSHETFTDSKALSSSVKRINRNLIFRHLYNNPGLSRQELIRDLTLSLPTLNTNLSELHERGLISFDDEKKSTGGRIPKAINVCSNACYSVGLDVTSHHLCGVIINLLGEVAACERIQTPFLSEDSYFQRMAHFVEHLIDLAGIDRELILGVGLSVPAIVSEDESRLTYASILNFTNGKIEDFAKYIPYSCRFVNDACASGFAEYWNNPVLKINNNDKAIVYLMISNSVGGAFFLDGESYCGQNLRANEFGHITLVPNGRECYCGQRGCADAYLNTKLLSDPYDKNLSSFFQSLSQGDPTAKEIWESYITYLAQLINTLRMVFDCNIVLGGYIGRFIPPHMHELRRLLADRNHFDSSADYLILCEYQHEAAAVGAALTYVDEFLQSV